MTFIDKFERPMSRLVATAAGATFVLRCPCQFCQRTQLRDSKDSRVRLSIGIVLWAEMVGRYHSKAPGKSKLNEKLECGHKQRPGKPEAIW